MNRPTPETNIERLNSLLETIIRTKNSTSIPTTPTIPSTATRSDLSLELPRSSTTRSLLRFVSKNEGLGAQESSMTKSPSSPGQYHSSPEPHDTNQLSPTHPASQCPMTPQIAIYTENLVSSLTASSSSSFEPSVLPDIARCSRLKKRPARQQAMQETS